METPPKCKNPITGIVNKVQHTISRVRPLDTLVNREKAKTERFAMREITRKL